MSYQTLETKITQVCNKADSLKTDITNINNAFKEKGIEVGETPSEEYGELLDKVARIDYDTLIALRGGFNYMFQNCTTLTEIPPFDTSNATSFFATFYMCSRLTAIPPIDTSKGTNFNSMFYNCANLTEIPPLDTSKGTHFDSMFFSCKKIRTIPILNVSLAINLSGVFSNCANLTTIVFEGTIPKTVSFKYCNLLSLESIASIVNALKDLTGSSSYTLTLNADIEAKLTEEQKAMITAKNWTLVY